MRTNDPSQPLLKLVVSANVKPLPSYVGRMNGADLAHGERVGSVSAWPTAHPSITLERGERFTGSIRLRPQPIDSINVTPRADGSANLGSLNGGNSGAKPIPEDSTIFSSKTRKDGTDDWVDLEIGPFNEPGTYIRRVEAPVAGGEKVSIDFSVLVISKATLLSSEKIDFGAVSLSELKTGRVVSTRVGLRRVAGALKITSIDSPFPFLKVETETIIPGINYVIRVFVDPTKEIKAGSYDGNIQINTDDPSQPKMLVPCKLTITEKP